MTNYLYFDLQLFAEAGNVVNVTTGTVNAYTGKANTTDAMSSTMKSFYNTELLENTREQLVFQQLGRKQTLPANHGKIVEWRKFATLPDAELLQEAVIPEGKTLSQTALTVPIQQYGMYVSVSDQLELHAVDDVILSATEELGAASGKTYDKLVRAVLMTNANTLFADELNTDGTVKSTPATRTALAAATGKAYLTPDMIAKAATILKKANTRPHTGGKYVAVVHPSASYDLRQSPQFIEFHKYAATTELFNGEIGELHGVRFVESTLAPIVKQGEKAVYLTMVFGAEAFAVVDPSGAGMETIIKDKREAGGPLNQFSTIGCKFSMGAAILYPERMVTIESMSSYSAIDDAN